MSIAWDETLSERLAGLWKTHTASEIATIFAADGYQVTRHSIIGRIFRMGLCGTRKSVAHQNTPRHIEPQRPKITRNNEDIGRSGQAVQAINRARRKVGTAPAPSFSLRLVDTDPLHLTLLQLTDAVCKYECSGARHPSEFTFCGQAVRNKGCPYCAKHAAVCFEPPKLRIKQKPMWRGAA